MALYLYLNNPKGLTSVLLSKYLGIRQGTTWILLHKIREMCQLSLKKFEGTVEVDETYMGGKRANMSKYKRMMLYHLERGIASKFPVVGTLHRETNQVMIAKVLEHTDQETLHEFINEQTTSDAVVHTDETRIAIDNAILDVMGIHKLNPFLVELENYGLKSRD